MLLWELEAVLSVSVVKILESVINLIGEIWIIIHLLEPVNLSQAFIEHLGC